MRYNLATRALRNEIMKPKGIHFILLAIVLILFCVVTSCTRKEQVRLALVLENSNMRLAFDVKTGLLTRLENKLTGESFSVQGDHFSITADEFTLASNKLQLSSLDRTERGVKAVYRDADRIIEVEWTLGTNSNFAEKRIALTSSQAYRLKKIILSELRFSAEGLKMVRYPYQKNVTYFGRTQKGGFFLGVELPFDSSVLVSDGTVTLGYIPSLKVKANERLQSEPIYLGVYKRGPFDKDEEGLPFRSESDAMVAMTSEILGPPRHGLVPMACGWWSEMEHFTYESEKQVRGDMRSLEFLAECGINWVSDSHPWGGETEKMNSLVGEQKYKLGELYRRFLEHSKKVGVNVVMWPTMNNAHPWWKGKGKPFRPDKPEWIMVPGGQDLRYRLEDGREFKGSKIEGNCIANEPFLNWLIKINMDGLETGYYSGWAMDGDFFGGGGFVIPVNCPSADHDHLPSDSNYASERALNRLTFEVRKRYPNLYIWLLRPPMDLGVWSHRNADATFTIDEFAELRPLPGLKDQPINVSYGDKIRKWSRVRVLHHFFPHYLDQPQVFVAPESMKGGLPWPSDKIDYVMLSALSSSPNQLYYMPTKKGIPDKDKAEIRKWLEWGRKNIKYLQVRKDLPDWPAAGKVDGSAHIIEDSGLIFLFNPNKQPLKCSFILDTEWIGLTKGKQFLISQFYPSSAKKGEAEYGQKVEWDVPGESAIVLEISPRQ